MGPAGGETTSVGTAGVEAAQLEGNTFRTGLTDYQSTGGS
jgi:hypothetical protein